MRSKAILHIVLALSFASSFELFAQEPALKRGFDAAKLYNFGGLDTINTYNGNLIVRIPLGPNYPVNGGLSYSLALTFNSKVWEYDEIANTYMLAVPSRHSNAGLGWALSLGRIMTPTNSTNDTPSWSYEDPETNLHYTSGVLHPGGTSEANVTYTNDSTYLRVKTGSTPTTEYPDGTVHTFDFTSGDLKEIADRFGNKATFTSLTSMAGTPCPGTDSLAWRITDSEAARTNYVCFQTFNFNYESLYGGKMVERVVLAAPPATEGGAARSATYTFLYDTPTIHRGPYSTYPNNSTVKVPLLTGILLPDGSAYGFTYNTIAAGDSGTLSSMSLPTGAVIGYTYQYFETPLDGCNHGSWTRFLTGVGQRTISGPRMPTATWTYSRTLNNPPNFQVLCEVHDVLVWSLAPPEEMVTAVTDPDGNVTEHYYSVWPDTDPTNQTNPDGFLPNEYSYPFTHKVTSGGYLLSTRTYTAAGYAATPKAPLRSVFVKYDKDDAGCVWDHATARCQQDNRRLTHERTVYHDDANRIADTDFTDFDGVGHFRSTELGGTFPAGNQTTYTAYNKISASVNPLSSDPNALETGSYPSSFVLPPTTHPWVLNTAPYATVTNAGDNSAATTYSCYNPLTGFLRALRKGTGSLNSDLIAIYTADTQGNRSKEQYYGGDVAQNAPTSEPLCTTATTPPTTAEYTISHTHTIGVPTTSSYTGFTFKPLDQTIDKVSGLRTSFRERSEFETKYGYDTAFRLTSVEGAGLSPAAYSYSVASGSGSNFAPARVEVKTISATDGIPGGATSGTVEKHYQYDALGRLWREKTRMPDNTWSLQEILYNAMGLKASVSEQEKLVIPSGGTELDFSPAHKTSYSSYDPFGRPGSVTLPDNHVTSFSYLGGQSMVRTTKIATALTGETDVPVTESYDRQGRLYQLTENSGANASALVTTYGYHVTGGLSSVSSLTQNRTFAFDGRGLLLYEQHPEKDGKVVYGANESQPSYDSRGHATRLIDGPIDLKYSYDSAERLFKVEDFVPNSTTRRTLKSFTYADTNSGSDLRKGKLVTATRSSHLTDGRAVTVTETNTYAGVGGSISKRDTAVSIDDVPFQTFSEGFAYDDLGERSRLTYPTCLIVCGSATGSLGILDHHYTNGALTSIAGYATIGYNANATVGSVAHSNGVIDTLAQDDNAMARPKSIAYSGFSSCAVPSLPVITLAPASLCSGQSGGASVPGQQGATFTWTIEGGSITSNTGLSITYTATSTTSVLLQVSAANNCGSSAIVTASVSVTASTAIQQQPQGTTIASGGTATLHVTAIGTALTYQWYRGFATDQSNAVAGATAADFTTPPLPATTTYWVKVTGQCGTANSSSATVSINLPAPTNLRATTQQATSQGGSNTVVMLRWNSVAGASAYLVEWSATVTGSFTAINPSNPTTVQLTATHVVAATALPYAYVYRVRSVDSGGIASPAFSNFDYAVAGSRLFASANAQDEPLRKGLSPVRAMDIVELRRGIDALRSAAGLSQVWAGAAAPSGFITADDFLSLQAPLNAAMQTFAYGAFAYSGVPPPARCISSPCVTILSEHVQQLRDTLRNALR